MDMIVAMITTKSLLRHLEKSYGQNKSELDYIAISCVFYAKHPRKNYKLSMCLTGPFCYLKDKIILGGGLTLD